VPEISVICCLSHIRSVPWLEQCFARANRIAAGKTEAIVFAPADWAFKKAMSMIEREQLTPLNNPEGQRELISENKDEQHEGNGNAKPWIIPLNSRAEHITREFIQDGQAPTDLPPWCPPSEAEKILRKNITGIVTAFLDNQAAGNKMAHSKMLYRRMKLICNKPITEMNQSELEKIWLWARKEYGERK
jgi:hypothetical protein